MRKVDIIDFMSSGERAPGWRRPCVFCKGCDSPAMFDKAALSDMPNGATLRNVERPACPKLPEQDCSGRVGYNIWRLRAAYNRVFFLTAAFLVSNIKSVWLRAQGAEAWSFHRLKPEHRRHTAVKRKTDKDLLWCVLPNIHKITRIYP